MAIWHIGDVSQKAGRSIELENYYQRHASPRQSASRNSAGAGVTKITRLGPAGGKIRRAGEFASPADSFQQMPPETSSAADSDSSAAELRAPEPSSEERALVAAVLAKDRKAAAEFVSRYADAVYAYVSRRLAPRADLVEDVVQEVFLVGLQKLATFAGQSSVVGWLLGIARHKVEDFYRAQLREPDPLPDGGDLPSAGLNVPPSLDELIDAARAEEKTRQILERLPAAYSAALQWRYWEKRTIREMAAQTGKTEKAIERLLARARTTFRRLWEAS